MDMRYRSRLLSVLLALVPVGAVAATPGVILPGQVMTADWFNGVRSAALGALQTSVALNSAGQMILPVAGDVTFASIKPAGSSATTTLSVYLNTLAAKANDAIPAAQINAPSGVAGLDTGGYVTAPGKNDVSISTVTYDQD